MSKSSVATSDLMLIVNSAVSQGNTEEHAFLSRRIGAIGRSCPLVAD